MYHSKGEKKIGEMAGSSHAVQIANEDLHETKFKPAVQASYRLIFGKANLFSPEC
jgi:hypothetical protein